MSNLFDLTTARFSRATALSLAQFSAIAYKAEGVVAAVAADGGLEFSWIENKETDTQGFVVSNDDAIVVCFRGTAEPEDWLSNLKTRKVDYERPTDGSTGWMVHRGFWAAYASVADQVMAAIKDHGTVANRRAKSILVTGHSLGGALATIAAYELACHTLAARLYTFGQPRVGDWYFINAVNNAMRGYHRFVHNNDVVPRIPFGGWGFRHAGRLNHIDHQGGVQLDPASWITFADRVLGRIKSRAWNPFKWTSDGIDDHSINQYVACLEAWAAE